MMMKMMVFLMNMTRKKSDFRKLLDILLSAFLLVVLLMGLLFCVVMPFVGKAFAGTIAEQTTSDTLMQNQKSYLNLPHQWITGLEAMINGAEDLTIKYKADTVDTTSSYGARIGYCDPGGGSSVKTEYCGSNGVTCSVNSDELTVTIPASRVQAALDSYNVNCIKYHVPDGVKIKGASTDVYANGIAKNANNYGSWSNDGNVDDYYFIIAQGSDSPTISFSIPDDTEDYPGGFNDFAVDFTNVSGTYNFIISLTKDSGTPVEYMYEDLNLSDGQELLAVQDYIYAGDYEIEGYLYNDGWELLATSPPEAFSVSEMIDMNYPADLQSSEDFNNWLVDTLAVPPDETYLIKITYEGEDESPHSEIFTSTTGSTGHVFDKQAVLTPGVYSVYAELFYESTGNPALYTTDPITFTILAPGTTFPEPDAPPVVDCGATDYVCKISNWFATGFVDIMKYLFVPGQSTMDRFGDLWDAIKLKKPIGYGTLIFEAFNGIAIDEDPFDLVLPTEMTDFLGDWDVLLASLALFWVLVGLYKEATTIQL